MGTLRFAGVHSRKLHGLDLELDVGVHALVGGLSDGTADVAQLAAGASRPRRGSVLVDGQSPWSSPRTRGAVGALLETEWTPYGESVAAVLESAAIADGARWLSAFGLGAHAKRAPRELPEPQSRALAALLAVATPKRSLIVLWEPLTLVGVDRDELLGALAAAADDGSCVLSLCAREEHAARLAPSGSVQRLEAGRLAGPRAPLSAAAAKLTLTGTELETLAARLAADAAVARLSLGARELTVEGPEASALNAAVLAAVASDGGGVESWSVAPLRVEGTP